MSAANLTPEARAQARQNMLDMQASLVTRINVNTQRLATVRDDRFIVVSSLAHRRIVTIVGGVSQISMLPHDKAPLEYAQDTASRMAASVNDFLKRQGADETVAVVPHREWIEKEIAESKSTIAFIDELLSQAE